MSFAESSTGAATRSFSRNWASAYPTGGDYVELHDSTTREEKRETIRRFYDYPRKSCHYCTWKSGDSAARHGAAEQEK